MTELHGLAYRLLPTSVCQMQPKTQWRQNIPLISSRSLYLWSIRRCLCVDRPPPGTDRSRAGRSGFVSLPPEREGIPSLGSSAHPWCTPPEPPETRAASVVSVGNFKKKMEFKIKLWEWNLTFQFRINCKQKCSKRIKSNCNAKVKREYIHRLLTVMSTIYNKIWNQSSESLINYHNYIYVCNQT